MQRAESLTRNGKLSQHNVRKMLLLSTISIGMFPLFDSPSLRDLLLEKQQQKEKKKLALAKKE